MPHGVSHPKRASSGQIPLFASLLAVHSYPRAMGDHREANGVGADSQPRTNGYTNGHTTNGRTNGTNGVNGVNGANRRTDSEEWFIGSIDQGTTSSRFLIFNRFMDPVASHQIEFENLYPESGYVLTSTLQHPCRLFPIMVMIS